MKQVQTHFLHRPRMEYLTQNVTELLLRFLVRAVVSMTGTSNSMKYMTKRLRLQVNSARVGLALNHLSVIHPDSKYLMYIQKSSNYVQVLGPNVLPSSAVHNGVPSPSAVVLAIVFPYQFSVTPG